MAISAHELGHALQDAEDYFPMRIRSMLVPAVNIGSNLGWILIMIGLVLRMTELAWIGVIVFSAYTDSHGALQIAHGPAPEGIRARLVVYSIDGGPLPIQATSETEAAP